MDTSQPDPLAAGEFYAGLFGWELEDVMPQGSSAPYLECRIGGERVGAIGSGAPARWNTYVWVDSADETTAKVREAGGTVVAAPVDVMEAGRMATFADPEGAAFRIWQPNEHRGAPVVDVHGTVNLNDLHTRDIEAAKAFYGAVFGWEELAMDGGFRMWTLPGYGDFLEEIEPGTGERNKVLGAPERYVDVVASIAPIPEDQPDAPAHWGVTFTVDDADAVAAKAEESGGTVVRPPKEMPAEESGGTVVEPATKMSWVRKTVIADPQGATFTASQFVPRIQLG